jgi:uncharacterized membrane protein YraQ (UPF0718 family)
MQTKEAVIHQHDAGRRARVLAGYRWALLALGGFLLLAFGAIVDLRRGFLFDHYAFKSAWYAFSPWHVVMLGVALPGILGTYRYLVTKEREHDRRDLEIQARLFALGLFFLLVADLLVYRGVAAGRIASSGELSLGWLNAFGATGWLRPPALAASYLLTVWHATFLGILLAGLALTALPRYMSSFLRRTGARGSLLGAAFSISQPFCSCCAAVALPSLAASGASRYFLLAFAVGSPMLNVTSIILAIALLPAQYVLVRVLAGIALAVPVTYAMVKIADGMFHSAHADPSARGPVQGPAQTRRWSDFYYRVFHFDGMLEGRRSDTPATLVATWLATSGRIALLTVPAMVIFSTATAAIIQVLPDSYGNNGASVLLAAVAGTFLMVPTWTEIGVSRQMLEAGLTGPAATVLVVLPAVSLPSLLIIGGAVRRLRTVALLALAVIALGAIAGFILL